MEGVAPPGKAGETEATWTEVVAGDGGPTLVVQTAILVVESGPDKGSERTVTHSPLVIGRGAEADLRLRDPLVSREHLRIEPTGTGWYVRDLDSKSGVTLAGLRVRHAELPFDVPLRIGATVLALRRQRVPMPLGTGPACPGMRGSSPAMRRLFALIERLGPLDLAVLVQGETGTGKELVARALHAAGRGPRAPYRVVDCGLLGDETQARSELFGHTRGAFTGADRERRGAFREANGGTLFLDEIGELPLGVQPQLLRILQEGEVRPLGSDATHRVRVRILAATHRDLAAEIEAGRFRRDLYHRLAGACLRVPPLRQREGDLAELAAGLLPEGMRLEDSAIRALEAYPWPGNVRELEQVLARAAALARGPGIQAEDLGLEPTGERGPGLASSDGTRGSAQAQAQAQAQAPVPGLDPSSDPAQVLETAQDRIARLSDAQVLEAIAGAGGNRERAARLLGISPSSLYRRLRKLRPDK